jgi:hypothetical protein
LATNKSKKPLADSKTLARAALLSVDDWLVERNTTAIREFIVSAMVEGSARNQLTDWFLAATHYQRFEDINTMLRLISLCDAEDAISRKAALGMQAFAISDEALGQLDNEYVCKVIHGALIIPKHISEETLTRCKQVMNDCTPPILVYPASYALVSTGDDSWIIDNADTAFSLWTRVVEQEVEGAATACYYLACKWLERASMSLKVATGAEKTKQLQTVSRICSQYDFMSWMS